MVNDENDRISLYEETNNKPAVIRLNKFKVVLFTLIVALIILSVITIVKNVKRTIENYKFYKEAEEQISSADQQKEQKEQAQKEKEEKAKQAKLPKLTDAGKEKIKHIYSSDTKRAFLTFDDGPSSVTDKILDELKAENIKATFFVLGSNVEKKPDEVKRMYNEGHFIANHGYSHVYDQIYSSPENVLNEYNQCNDAVKKALGENDYESHLFRFPGGLAGGKYAEVKEKANELLEQNNIAHVDWNALNGDAETNDLTPELELSRLDKTTGNKNSVVILMHDSPAKSVTAETLPQIIKLLRDKGYEFKNFYDIMNDEQ